MTIWVFWILLLAATATNDLVVTASFFPTSGSCQDLPSTTETTNNPPSCSDSCQEFLKTHPYRVMRWRLVLRSFFPNDNGFGEVEISSSEKENTLRCLWDELERVGATNLERTGYYQTDISCEASFHQIQPIVLTNRISGLEYRCIPSDCDNCFNYSSEHCCLADGLCNAVYGMRYSDTEDCVEKKVYAGCGSYIMGCDTATYRTLGTDDSCYWFSNGCFPKDKYKVLDIAGDDDFERCSNLFDNFFANNGVEECAVSSIVDDEDGGEDSCSAQFKLSGSDNDDEPPQSSAAVTTLFSMFTTGFLWFML